jgi:dTDP-4-dehydrorhamnose reductase
MKNKILITGISGMLGSAVFRTFQKSANYVIYGVSRNPSFTLTDVEMLYGDLSDVEFIKFINIKNKFDIIIHCSAEVNVNLCETDKEHAYNSNVVATENLVSLAPKLIIYISTDAVFDGQVGNYTEDDTINPLNYYAQTKLLGENAILKSSSDYLILRTNIYGFNNPMKNSLFEWAYKELINSKTINGFSNMYFNPLYVGQIARLIFEWVKLDIQKGIYNIGSDDFVSKHEFLQNIIKFFDFNDNQLNNVVFDTSQFVAPRALNTTLNISKTKEIVSNFNFSLESGFVHLKNDLEVLFEKST